MPPNKKMGGAEVYFSCPNLRKNTNRPSWPLGRKVVIMAKTRLEQKNRNERTSIYNSQIIKIRDWLGFFFTVAGVCLSLSGSVHIDIDIQIQYNTVIEVYNNSHERERTRWSTEDFFLDTEDGTDSMRKDNTDKQKHPIEWAYINISEFPEDILKRKKRTIIHILH